MLGWTRLHRSREAAVFDAPYEVVHVRERWPGGEPGAAFTCPLEHSGPPVALGSAVTLRTHIWRLPDGSTFAGTVAVGPAGAP